MPEPVATAAISTAATTVSSTLSIARFISDIKNTPTDVKTCFDLTHRIEDDLQTLINLRTRHEKYLLTVPDTLKRLDNIIYATKESILDVCRLLEGCRKEVFEGNTIPLGSKMKWVLGDSVAFTRRTANLQQQHAALNVEIVSLRQLEMLKPLERIATTTFENLELLSMERKKGLKRDSRVESKDFRQSTQSFELGTSPVASTSSTRSQFSPQPLRLKDDRTISNKALPNVPSVSEFKMKESEIEEKEVEDNEDDDAENAFYRDLRRQEEERQRRLAARRRIGQ